MATLSSPAGVGPAGHDAPENVAALDPTNLVAGYFDPQTRSYPIEDGQLIDVHPVDQEVALRLGVPLGALAASPAVGIDLRRLKRASPENMQATVTDVVRVALTELIQRGDIRLIGVPLDPNAEGRPFFFVDYENLRLPRGAGVTRMSVGV